MNQVIRVPCFSHLRSKIIKKLALLILVQDGILPVFLSYKTKIRSFSGSIKLYDDSMKLLDSDFRCGAKASGLRHVPFNILS